MHQQTSTLPAVSHRSENTGTARRQRADSQTLVMLGGFTIMLLLTLVIGLSMAIFIASDDGRERPTTSFEFSYAENPGGNETLSIRHDGGDTIAPAHLYVELSEATCTGEGDPDGLYNVHEDFGIGEDNELRAGNSISIDRTNPTRMCERGALQLDGASVTLLYEDRSGDLVTLDSWEP